MKTLPHPMPQSLVRWKRGLGLCALVLLLFAGLTWLAVIFDLDLRLAGVFFREAGGWVFRHDQPWKALYAYGTVPGLALTLVCLAVFFMGFVRPRLRDYQKYMLVVVLTAVLGAGVLVNGVLKPYCGRPRPGEIKPFGGQWEYCLPCQGSSPAKGHSFPCGHCTMGFLFVSLIFCARKSRLIAVGGGVFGLLYGGLMGVARAAQGAHFATDTLWSLGAIVVTSLLLYDIVLPLIERSLLFSRELSRRQLWVYGACITLLAAVITTAFLTRRPYYGHWSRALEIPAQTRQVLIRSNIDFAQRDIRYNQNPAGVRIQAQGFGWVNARQKVKVTSRFENHCLTITITAVSHSYFAELQHDISLRLPRSLKGQVALDFQPHHRENTD